MGGIFILEKVIAHNAWCTGQGWSLHFSLISKITRVIFNWGDYVKVLIRGGVYLLFNLDESHWSLKETNGVLIWGTVNDFLDRGGSLHFIVEISQSNFK